MPVSVGVSSYSSLRGFRYVVGKKNSVSFSFYVGKVGFCVIDSETDDVIRRMKMKWKSSGSFGSLAIKVLLSVSVLSVSSSSSSGCIHPPSSSPPSSVSLDQTELLIVLSLHV